MGLFTEGKESGVTLVFVLDDTAHGLTGANLGGARNNGVVDSELADTGRISNKLSAILTEQLANGLAVVLFVGQSHFLFVHHKGNSSGSVLLTESVVESHNEDSGGRGLFVFEAFASFTLIN